MRKLLRNWIEGLYEATESWVERESHCLTLEEHKEAYLSNLPSRMAERYVAKNYNTVPRHEKYSLPEFDCTKWYVVQKSTGIVCERGYNSIHEALRSVSSYHEEYYSEWVRDNLHNIDIPNRRW